MQQAKLNQSLRRELIASNVYVFFFSFYKSVIIAAQLYESLRRKPGWRFTAGSKWLVEFAPAGSRTSALTEEGL